MSIEPGTWHKARYGRLAHKVVRVVFPPSEIETACGAWRIALHEVAGDDVERCKTCEEASA